jgi:hypothetical protein
VSDDESHNIVDQTIDDDAGLRVLQHVLDLPMEAYAKQYLKIRTKSKGIKPFEFNVGQRYLDEVAERQMKVRGYVRIILLKARQWGGSTYVEGRFYRKITQGERGLRAQIVTQSKDASSNIFGMAQRFHNEMDPRLRPYSGRSNVTQLVFPKRDALYQVGTAGSLNIGRSDTIQMLHASEFAFWPNADSHLSGVFQTVPTQGPGSEIWIESTGMGMNNEFYTQVDLARKRLSEYEFVFVPWFWFDEYKATPRGDLEEHLTEEDRKYQEIFGLSDEQMAFRFLKIIEFGGGTRGRERFKTEYPTTPEDAFSTTGEGSYIDVLHVARARKNVIKDPFGPRIMGIDPAWLGKDRFSVHMRQGRKAWIAGEWQGKRTTQSVGKCIQIIKREKPQIVFVDAIGVGAGVVDQLTEIQETLGCRVVTVMASEDADDDRLYGNKREEMAGRLNEWLQMDLPVQIDDRDDLQRDMTALQLEYTADGRPRPESKQKFKVRTKGKAPSPDHFDSLCLTFAYDVAALALGRAGSEVDPDRPINWRAT